MPSVTENLDAIKAIKANQDISAEAKPDQILDRAVAVCNDGESTLSQRQSAVSDYINSRAQVLANRNTSPSSLHDMLANQEAHLAESIEADDMEEARKALLEGSALIKAAQDKAIQDAKDLQLTEKEKEAHINNSNMRALQMQRQFVAKFKPDDLKSVDAQIESHKTSMKASSRKAVKPVPKSSSAFADKLKAILEKQGDKPSLQGLMQDIQKEITGAIVGLVLKGITKALEGNQTLFQSLRDTEGALQKSDNGTYFLSGTDIAIDPKTGLMIAGPDATQADVDKMIKTMNDFGGKDTKCQLNCDAGKARVMVQNAVDKFDIEPGKFKVTTQRKSDSMPKVSPAGPKAPKLEQIDTPTAHK